MKYFILIFEYEQYAIIASFDGIDKTAIRDERDDGRFMSLIETPLSMYQQICLVEAGLIRYFQPTYNEIYKDSFPASDQKILDDCYKVDFSGLVVEIDTEELRLLLHSSAVKSKEHHLAQFDLVDPTARRSFFTFVDEEGKAFSTAGVIPPSR